MAKLNLIKFNPGLCIGCQVEEKQDRSAYCQKCYEKEFQIKINEE